MNFLSLNCHGLGNPQTVRELHDLVKQEDPKIVFLSETRLELEKLEVVRSKLGMQGYWGSVRSGIRFGYVVERGHLSDGIQSLISPH